MRHLESTAMLVRPDDGLEHTDPWGERMSRSALDGRPESRLPPAVAWLVPALAMALVGGTSLTTPALWTDELATWGMTGVDWSQMWPLLRYVDAVLAPYYVLMRTWTDLAGSSDLALRLPSLLAMVGAAALVGRLGTRLTGPVAGLLAGLVFVALPSITRFAQEARPYALATFAAVLSTYLLVGLCERRTWTRVVGYALAVAMLGLLHMIGLLLLVAHGWTVLAWRRAVLGRWLAGVVLGVLPVVPLLWLGVRQRNQVSYIPEIGVGTFGESADVLFGSAGIALLVVALALFSLPLRYPSAVHTAWAVVPALALAVVSIAMPLFLPRYLIFTVPAWALLVGVTLSRVRLPLALVALAGVVALGLPAHLSIRGPAGHEEATRDVAAILTDQVRPGDAAVYAASETKGGWTTRDLVDHYVPAARRPADPLLRTAPRTGGLLLATECADVSRCLGTPGRIWVLRLGELSDPLSDLGPEKEKLLRADYRITQAWRPEGMTLALLVRER